MGKRHALNLLKGRVKGAKLIAVCDTDCEKTRYFAGKKVFCTADYREVAAKKPDCVIIATEHYKHAEIASYFLEKRADLLLSLKVIFPRLSFSTTYPNSSISPVIWILFPLRFPLILGKSFA